jgi:NAD(P)-dependent dehydrogenase (short-subunit alcohol dehydrogenase family)
VYVVFGAGGGIGSALTCRLVGAGGGAKVVAVGHQDGQVNTLPTCSMIWLP